MSIARTGVRQDMRRKNKTSLLKRIITTLPVFGGVVAGGFVLVYAGSFIRDVEIPEILPVESVQVVGELKFLNKEAIEETVKRSISGGYFTVDLTAVRDLLQYQPWVRSVSLRRVWPASITVTIEEQVPVAYWNDDGYINEAGKVFKPAAVNTALNLPKLSGPEGHHDNVWKFMNQLYQEMALLDYEVTRLKLDDRRAWQLVISTRPVSSFTSQADIEQGIDVKLGRFDTQKRLERFIGILPSLIASQSGSDDNLMFDTNKIESIDMRYPNGFAVKMADEEMLDKDDNSQRRDVIGNGKVNYARHSISTTKHTVQTGEA